MKNNDVAEISVRFDQFFDILNLSSVELEKKRQHLIKADAIREANGKEFVLLQRCAECVLEELSLLRMKVMATRSHDDVQDYALTSLGYLRIWCCFLSSRIPSKETSIDKILISNMKKGYKNALNNYEKIYDHLRTALKINLELNISVNAKE